MITDAFQNKADPRVQVMVQGLEERAGIVYIIPVSGKSGEVRTCVLSNGAREIDGLSQNSYIAVLGTKQQLAQIAESPAVVQIVYKRGNQPQLGAATPANPQMR